MKRFEYFKLNFNMAKNETMIAMILAFIAPLFASLGEKESIRSFLMGTDGPSLLQMIVGVVVLAIAMALLFRGMMKIGYDNLFGEAAQIYSSLPISHKNVATIKIVVLTLNTLISMAGFALGMVLAYIFGNNAYIDSLCDNVIILATSGVLKQVIVLPLGVLAIVTTAFFVNGYIFCGFTNAHMRPKGLLGKLVMTLVAMLPLLPAAYLLIKTFIDANLFVEIENLYIILLIIIGVSLVLSVFDILMSIYWLNKRYYI